MRAYSDAHPALSGLGFQHRRGVCENQRGGGDAGVPIGFSFSHELLATLQASWLTVPRPLGAGCNLTVVDDDAQIA